MRYRDLLTVMQPQAGATLPAASNTAISQYEMTTPDSCTAHGFNANGLVDAFKDARAPPRGAGAFNELTNTSVGGHDWRADESAHDQRTSKPVRS